jgi:hypothetical protein
MPRNRIISAAQSLFVGPTGKYSATGNHFESGDIGANLTVQLHRIQNCNYSFNIPRQPINQFGELAAIDRINLSSPTVPLSFSYLLANFWNEHKMGFVVDGTTSCLSGFLTRETDEKNYFIRFVPEGKDALAEPVSTDSGHTVGIGNAFITSYSVSASVGNLPVVNVGVEGLNLTWDDGCTGNSIPAIDPNAGTRMSAKIYSLPVATTNPMGATAGDLAISALKPGDITVTIRENGTTTSFREAGVDIDDSKIQSFNLSFDLSREQLQKLGSRFAFAREPRFPIDVRVDIDAQVGDLTTGDLQSILCDDTDYDITVTLKKSSCTAQGNPVSAYILRKCKLDSESFSSDIGGNKRVSASFVGQLGGPNQTGVVLLMSGAANSY